jgi:hypothetical protein
MSVQRSSFFSSFTPSSFGGSSFRAENKWGHSYSATSSSGKSLTSNCCIPLFGFSVTIALCSFCRCSTDFSRLRLITGLPADVVFCLFKDFSARAVRFLAKYEVFGWLNADNLLLFSCWCCWSLVPYHSKPLTILSSQLKSLLCSCLLPSVTLEHSGLLMV